MVGKSDYFNSTGILLDSECKFKVLRTLKNYIFQLLGVNNLIKSSLTYPTLKNSIVL